MGESIAEIGHERVIEVSPSGPVEDRGREYRVDRSAAGVTHHELLRDAQGDVLYDQGELVRFVLGSGVHGRSYLIEHEGRLFQSPLGWYSGAGRWDLSPGYRGAGSPRFERSIGDGCLSCHAGRMERGPANGRYGPGVFAEAAIGCERCHGPGGRHMALMRSADAAAAHDPCIVQPARLDAARREDVCNQCHLGGEAMIPRTSRTLFDFRPGDRLEDTRVVLVNAIAGDAPDGRPVGHVEQMRASRCFQASAGRLGCTSCHDPHVHTPRAEAAVFHASRCASCHDDGACSLPAADRERPPASGSCIHCHMPRRATEGVPHTALTDHTIPRHAVADAAPNSAPDSASGSTGPTPATAQRSPGQPGKLVPFDGAGTRLPPHEVDRATGLHLTTLALTQRNASLAAAAESLLLRGQDRRDAPATAAAALGHDADTLAALAAILGSTGRDDAACILWERLLAVDPDHEEALATLAEHRGRSGRLPEAISLADRLVAAHPSIAANHALRGKMLAADGRLGEAIRAVETALARDPSLVALRRWLAEGLRRIGRTDEAVAEADLARRIEQAGSPSREVGPRRPPAVNGPPPQAPPP